MPSRRLTFPAVAMLAIASLALGVVAALADGRDAAKPRASVRAAIARAVPPTPAVVVAAKDNPFWRAAVPNAPCPVAEDKPPAAAPVPQNLLDAFGVLRRERADADALPADALKALRQRGLAPFDPAAARLLRQTDDGGRAWVVAVRDVPANPTTVFALGCVQRTLSRQRDGLLRWMRAHPGGAPNTTNKPASHPGLAVVAIDGAPAGAGGRLEDLVRGREPVAIDPCGGPNHDMLSVSGIVPDGVGAAFLTSPDGTAVRADVKDNAYAFVVPRPKRAEQRYVVWTGGDGTPHVQPLGSPVFFGRVRCAAPTDRRPPVVSPDGSDLCGHFERSPAIVVPTIPTPSRRTPAPGPPPLLYRAPCALATPLGSALPVPPTVRVLPKAPRAPKRHG